MYIYISVSVSKTRGRAPSEDRTVKSQRLKGRGNDSLSKWRILETVVLKHLASLASSRFFPLPVHGEKDEKGEKAGVEEGGGKEKEGGRARIVAHAAQVGASRPARHARARIDRLSAAVTTLPLLPSVSLRPARFSPRFPISLSIFLSRFRAPPPSRTALAPTPSFFRFDSNATPLFYAPLFLRFAPRFLSLFTTQPSSSSSSS